jgi:Tfp pilus assembly protein PilF
MAVAHSNLGECLLKTGDVGGAEGHFRQALAIEPNHTLTKFRLASVAIKLDSPSKELLYEAEALYVVRNSAITIAGN